MRHNFFKSEAVCVYLLPTLIYSRFTTLPAVVSSQSQSNITNDSQSASLSWCQAPIWDPRPIIPFSVFLRSESHGTHEHILLSLLLRLPQLGGLGSCIYFPQEQGSPVISPGIGSPSCKCHTGKLKVMLRQTVSQSVCHSVKFTLEPVTRCLLLSDDYCCVSVGRPLWRDVGSVFCQ
jgi:hypothetical protein